MIENYDFAKLDAMEPAEARAVLVRMLRRCDGLVSRTRAALKASKSGKKRPSKVLVARLPRLVELRGKLRQLLKRYPLPMRRGGVVDFDLSKLEGVAAEDRAKVVPQLLAECESKIVRAKARGERFMELAKLRTKLRNLSRGYRG